MVTYLSIHSRWRHFDSLDLFLFFLFFRSSNWHVSRDMILPQRRPTFIHSKHTRAHHARIHAHIYIYIYIYIYSRVHVIHNTHPIFRVLDFKLEIQAAPDEYRFKNFALYDFTIAKNKVCISYNKEYYNINHKKLVFPRLSLKFNLNASSHI